MDPYRWIHANPTRLSRAQLIDHFKVGSYAMALAPARTGIM